MKANNTIESRVKCYGDNEMDAKANELRNAGYNRVENAYWVEHWQKDNALVILERCDESERPAEPAAPAEFSELTHAGQCLDIYLMNTSDIYERYTLKAIAAVADAKRYDEAQPARVEDATAWDNLTFWISWQSVVKNALKAAARLVVKHDHLTPTQSDIDQITRNYAAYIVDCAKHELEAVAR